MGSVAAAGVLGVLFLFGLTMAIDDITKATASGSPVATIMRDQLGAPTERILLVVIAFFGGGLVSMTSCARIVFAMSRDRFPANRLMKQVSPRTQTPIAATVLPLTIGIIAMVVIPGDALIELITAGTLFPAITYGLVVTLYLVVRKRLDRRSGAFDLGRFELYLLRWSHSCGQCAPSSSSCPPPTRPSR